MTVSVTPQLLGAQLGRAVGSLRGADPRWLVVAGAAYGLAYLSNVGAWRSSLRAVGCRTGFADALSRLGIGSVVNTFAPARAGDAVKILLFSRALEGGERVWTASGVYAAVGASRTVAIAVLTAGASCSGLMPVWPSLALGGMAAAFIALGRLASRTALCAPVARLTAGLRALVDSPRFGLSVVGWSAVTTLARLAGTAALAVATGIPHPLVAAFLIAIALDVAGTLPLTPGNFGVASGAVVVALAGRGVPVAHSIGIGLAIQALETAVSLLAGSFGAVWFGWHSLARRRRVRLAAPFPAAA